MGDGAGINIFTLNNITSIKYLIIVIDNQNIWLSLE